ncbi:hypothetical protein QJS04_geneDACA017285 [Acorus gramineus]|uniref:Uncharacterized protein n=1 Tax=Acorus gramineus TaxID=55184 RepID=A0AAV8ZZF9_ACOGR|nr:hypothetical protein QJS04_geneDACA024115 [Acorus gramineus]KAK1258498.1 hypothetical protein QJS04_geneDACA017285 [Acorus gramineus]
MRDSFKWDYVENQSFWGLLTSEVAVTDIQVDRIVLGLSPFLVDPRSADFYSSVTWITSNTIIEEMTSPILREGQNDKDQLMGGNQE